MIINKFQGKTEEEAKAKARQELGEACVIMNVKEIKGKGLFKKKVTYEVTAALEEKDDYNVGSITKPKKISSTIDLAADEKVVIPPPEREFSLPEKKNAKAAPEERRTDFMPKREPMAQTARKADILPENEPAAEDTIEKRLENLTSFLDEKQGGSAFSREEESYMKLIYNSLLASEVDEHYANQIMEEVEHSVRPGNNVDMILSNVYQKLILRLGRPAPIATGGVKPKLVFVIGPTGVGKTTTIAKIASKFKVEEQKEIAFITADTYRIAATEQLNVYAEILNAPLEVVFSSEELNAAVEKFSDRDLIFVDTAGFSHKNAQQRSDIRKLIEETAAINKEVYLVLSATTKYSDLINICNIYKEIADYKLIFTKLDETDHFGNLLNIRLHTQSDLSYVTAGQNVPDDIELLNPQKIVKQLLGGN